MKINVPHVAKLANLTLNESEIEKFEKQLSDILSYVEKLKEVDTKNIEIASQVTRLENVTREDIATQSLNQDEALSNVKPARSASHSDAGGSQHNGFVKVKVILDQ